MGVRVSMGDFGTGYSSGVSERLPVDAVKIDRSSCLTPSATPRRNDHDGYHRLARTLNLRTVAEGVETAQQLSDLTAQSCDEVQGTYLPGDSGEDMGIKLAERLPDAVKLRRPRVRKAAIALAAGVRLADLIHWRVLHLTLSLGCDLTRRSLADVDVHACSLELAQPTFQCVSGA